MKKLMNFTVLVLVVLSLLLSTACKDEADDVLPVDDGVEIIDPETVSKEIPVSSGSIGLLIDTRPIVKDGYFPKTVQVNFSGDLAAFSKELPVDKFTNLAILEIPQDSLTADELARFKKGVAVDIAVKDESEKELSKTAESSLVINDSNLILPVKSDLKKVIAPVKLNPKLEYIVQQKTDEENGNQVMGIPFDDTGLVWAIFNEYLGGDYQNQNFYFEPAEAGNDSTYYIKAKHSGHYLSLSGVNVVHTFVDNISQLGNPAKFILSADSDGWITIKAYNGVPLKLSLQTVSYIKPGSTFFTFYDWKLLSTEKGDPVKFRIVAAGINWSATDLGTEFNNPIMSPAKMDFSYKAVLKNCSPAVLSESVGKQDNRVSSYNMSSEESFQLSTTHSATLGLSASYTASASFYGVGVQTSYEASASYTYTNTMTETQTKTFETGGQTEVQVSRVRSLEIPANTAVEVYDVIQTISNIKVPFVQKIRVEGELNGVKLAGKEIIQQLMSNQFGGVVTEVGSSHVIITVRGFSEIDKLMEVRTNIEEVVGGCD